MADPVSSVAYAIEAPLRALDGDPASLVATMAIVVGVIAVVSATYHQLIGRFPTGGGGPKGIGEAFGEGWAFVPLGALLVDFTLTVAVSCSAGAAALIAYAPELAGGRLAIALVLTLAVAAGVLVGHRGRIGFALATQGFLLLAAFVIIAGFLTGPGAEGGVGGSTGPLLADASFGAVLLALPLGMALATGVEAPSDAIAELPQLRDAERRRFGRLTLWLMVSIVGGLTICFAVLAVRLGAGLPDGDSTLLAETARQAVGDGLPLAGFQGMSALLLLAAAASSFLAGSGVLKALASVGSGPGRGLLPEHFSRDNRFLVSHWGVFAVLGVSAAMIIAAGAKEQKLVHFYAVSVFASFLAATVGCARLSYRDGRRLAAAVNLAGAALVALVLALNLTRLDSAIALAASGLVALYFWRTWVNRGRPAGLLEAAG